MKKTVLHVVCAWWGKPVGEKDGLGQEGVSHTLCAECCAKVQAGTWQPPAEGKKVAMNIRVTPQGK